MVVEKVMGCEMLIRVEDRFTFNSLDTEKTFKEGEVVSINRLNFEWGIIELRKPHWRILRISDMSYDEGLTYLLSENTYKKEGRDNWVHRRMLKINIQRLPKSIKGLIYDARLGHIPVTAEMVRNAREEKLPLRDPRVFGNTNTVVPI